MNIAPVIAAGARLQLVQESNVIKETKYTEYGIWKTVFCANATTESLHKENDCSYTVIHVPLRKEKYKKTQYRFLFNFNPDQSLELMMDQNLTFMFSGFLLMHRQTSEILDYKTEAADNFFNI